MKCRYSENDVALYVEGDLTNVKAREFDAHLQLCDSCRELAEELRESQSVFKSLGQDIVSSAALAHVRTRVLAEVGGGRVKAGWGRWVYAVAGMAFVAVIGVGLAKYGRRAEEPKVQQVVKVDPLPPSLDASPYRARASRSRAAVPLPRGTMTTPKVEKRIARSASASVSVPLPEGDSRPQSGRQGVAHTEIAQTEAPDSPEPPKQIVVKLLTDDPNIVIYWLLDQETDQKNGGAL